MRTLADAWTVVLLAVGVAFFVAGTAGVVRFGDLHSRLHAVTKADSVGLGLVVAALLPQAAAPHQALRLVAVWLAALAASATACFLLARHGAGDA